MLYSIDSLSPAVYYDTRPSSEELTERGFTAKEGNFDGATTWFLNSSEHALQLSFYELWRGGFRLRADVSVPKLLYSNNVQLPTGEEIIEAMYQLSKIITAITGCSFDALLAAVIRIDYALNHQLPNKDLQRFFERNRRLNIPWLPFRPDLEYPNTIYYGGNSRMIRIYDKLLKELGPEESKNCIEALIRMEYSLRNEAAVRQFSKRLKLGGTSVGIMIAEASRKAALDEMVGLLKLNEFVPESDFSFKYFYEQTDSIPRARKCSSFVDAYESLGRDFHARTRSGISKATYKRQLAECQKYGW